MPAYFKCLAVASLSLLANCGQVCNTLHLALRFQRCTRIDLHGACDIADGLGTSGSDRSGIQFLTSLQQPLDLEFCTISFWWIAKIWNKDLCSTL